MTDHINTAFPEEKRPMMYKMMKWWGGKPHNIWSKYIEVYSQEGDIVLDPFCGRGVGVIEAVKRGRRAIGVDLNPIAIFQAAAISTNIDVDRIKEAWEYIKKDLKEFENDSRLFYTVCTRCHNQARLITMNRKNDTPYELFYSCTCDERSLQKKPTKEDLRIVKQHINIPWRYPSNKFPQSKLFTEARRKFGDRYDQLFTQRNLYALACIFDRINKIPDLDLKKIFQFAFISMVHLATKFPAVRKTRSTSGSWGRPGFIKLKQNMEINPYVLFERAIEGHQGIICGKTNSAKRLGKKTRRAKNLKDIKNGKGNLLLLHRNSLELEKLIPENSIDCIITDPPYGGLIQYFDLSSVWSSWLEMDDSSYSMPFDDEITVDDIKGKPFDEYHRMLSIVFGQLYRFLKPEKYMIVTFHNDRPMVFNSIMRACQDQGFLLQKVLFQMNRRPGEAGAASPWGTSVSDFYLRFYKPKERLRPLSSFVSTKFETIVRSVAKKIVAERGEPTEISAMVPDIYTEMGKSGMLIDFKDDDQISTILHGDGDFVELDRGQWWLSADAISRHHLRIPLSERVETAILSILQSKYKVSYDDVLQTIFEKFQNSLTPSTDNVKAYLGHYAKKTSDGKWKRRPDVDKDEMNKAHTKLEVILCKLGVRFGYKVYCADRSKDRDLQKICSDFNMDVDNAERVKKIDVLWIKEGSIKYMFEVENSTSITSALERGSNVKRSDLHRMIVIPKARDSFLGRKMKEPMFQEYFKKDKWGILWYENLTDNTPKTEDDLIKMCAVVGNDQVSQS